MNRKKNRLNVVFMVNRPVTSWFSTLQTPNATTNNTLETHMNGKSTTTVSYLMSVVCLSDFPSVRPSVYLNNLQQWKHFGHKCYSNNILDVQK